jgi:3-methyladenine DNA glycosylase AlkC
MIIKLKNPNFAEAHHKGKKIIIKTEGENELNETNLNILNELKYYITENRKNSVLSKLDDLQKRNTKMVLGLVVKDAFTDFQKDNPNVITQETRSLFTKKLFNYTASYFLVGEVEEMKFV